MAGKTIPDRQNSRWVEGNENPFGWTFVIYGIEQVSWHHAVPDILNHIFLVRELLIRNMVSETCAFNANGQGMQFYSSDIPNRNGDTYATEMWHMYSNMIYNRF